MPKPHKHRTTPAPVEPNRVQLILQRLQEGFYDSEPASDRLAAAVLADLKDLDKNPSVLPH